MAAFEWDCDCGWEWDLDSPEWSAVAAGQPAAAVGRHPPPPPPPFFDMPPPPLPPSLQPPAELCSTSVGHPLGLETCQAFLVSDAERQVPLDSSYSAAAIYVTALVLTVTFLIIGVIAWRFRKQKVNQKALLRCQQKSINGGTGGVMDGVPALLQGLNGRPLTGEDDEGVFYDELISYPPQFRAPNHPPAYEMKDVLLEPNSPCHCTAHPLLGNVGSHGATRMHNQPHYVTSPYLCGSHSPPSSTPTIDDQHDSSWITEPVYEELPSGPEEDGRFSRDPRGRHRNGSVSINDSLPSQRGGSADQRPCNNYSSNWSGGDEPAETDFFLPPTTWYHQPSQQHSSSPILRGQLTTQGSVRQGRGGIRAAWREVEPSLLQTQSFGRPLLTSSAVSQPAAHSGRRKRKVKSIKTPGGLDHTVPASQTLHYHSTGLYRGKCPPEEPPVLATEQQQPEQQQQLDPLLFPEPEDNGVSLEQLSAPTKTQPRYYYYSESDDYGSVVNQPRTLSGSRRGQQQQRHLSRVHRTLQARSPTSSDVKNVS